MGRRYITTERPCRAFPVLRMIIRRIVPIISVPVARAANVQVVMAEDTVQRSQTITVRPANLSRGVKLTT